MPELLPGLRRASRSLAARPAFALVALATLALGVGSASAVFTLVHAVLLRPLPYRDPGRLVAVADVSHGQSSGVGMANYRDWRRDNTVFEEMALAQFSSGILGTGSGQPDRAEGAEVSASFFRLLGVEPVLGRAFAERDERTDGAVEVIVLGHRLWERGFGADPAVVGRAITFDGRPCTVAGVMPAGFWYGERAGSDFYAPLRYAGSGRGQHQYSAIARLKPGVTLEAAQAQMSAIARRIERTHAEARGWGVLLTPLDDDVRSRARQPLAVLSAAVALVLLVACANLASLLLVRTTSRAREIAVRLALGAGRAAVLRQVLAEGLLLAAAGAGAGLALAAALVRAVASSLPARFGLPVAPAIDWRVAAFALMAAFLSTLVAAVPPASRAWRVDVSTALKGGGYGAGAGPRRGRLLRAAVVGQVSLATVLLVAGALLALSVTALLRADLGFDPGGVLTLQVRHLGAVRPPEASVAFYEELIARIEALPGVRSAAATRALPLSNQFSGGPFRIEGRPAPEEWRKMSAQYCPVTPGFFRVLGLSVRGGRPFLQRDRGTPQVAIVNEALAARHWPGADPVGARVRLGNDTLTIVGVVSDVRYNGAAAAAPPAIYYPHAQAPGWGLFLAVRLEQGGRPGAAASDVIAGIRRLLRQMDPGAVPVRVRPMDDLVAERAGPSRLIARLVSGFAFLALVLAATALYGTMGQWVGQRRRELGIRLALGARPGEVLRLVLGQGLRLSLFGGLIGLAAAAALTRTMSALLYGIGPHDPLAFTLVAPLLGAAAVLACWDPARRAARIDPAETLRSE